MKHLPRTIIAATCVTPLALAACGSEENANPSTAPLPSSSTTTVTSSTSAAASPTPADPASPPSTLRVAETAGDAPAGLLFTSGQAMQSPAPGAELALQDIRTGSHEGFDRVVFEFSGTGVPGFIAGYTAEPRQQASGYPLDVAGSAYLQVMVQGTPMGMTSATTALDTPGRLDVAPAGSIVGLSSGGTFEADTQFVIGLDAQRPFRAYTLENPTRVVVDVETTA